MSSFDQGKFFANVLIKQKVSVFIWEYVVWLLGLLSPTARLTAWQAASRKTELYIVPLFLGISKPHSVGM